MSGTLKIDFSWLPREHDGDAVERATYADLEVTVAGHVATEVEDLRAKTVRRTVRVSAYHLACWLASNWWRLRWEPERSDHGWKMSHMLGAVGAGYVWPDVTFCSEQADILVLVRPTVSSPAEPIRYLAEFCIPIPAQSYEDGVDEFMDGLLARLDAERTQETGLRSLWREILEERRDSQRSDWRKLEAILGFDPDEAPERLIEELRTAGETHGRGAIEELAAGSMVDAAPDLRSLENGRSVAVPVRVDNLCVLRDRIAQASRASQPWSRGESVAAIARDTWSLRDGPVSDQLLSDLFAMPRTLLNEGDAQAPISAGFRNDPNDLRLLLGKRHPTARRFALARVIGDHLVTADLGERILPVTDAKTGRQKFQRAFAQEFLCPYHALSEFLSTGNPTDDEIDDAAAHFNVSPLVVKTTLVNRGILDRGAFLAEREREGGEGHRPTPTNRGDHLNPRSHDTGIFSRATGERSMR